MPKLIKDGLITEDRFVLVDESEDGSLTLPDGPVLVRLAVWQKHRDELVNHAHDKGIQLAPADFAETILADLDALSLIAIEFPSFVDGRGYSTASLLRGRYGYKGEIRAVGDVFKDTLFYLQRCGFNSFAVRADKNIEDALSGLATFTVRYQGGIDQPPLYQRRLMG